MGLCVLLGRFDELHGGKLVAAVLETGDDVGHKAALHACSRGWNDDVAKTVRLEGEQVWRQMERGRGWERMWGRTVRLDHDEGALGGGHGENGVKKMLLVEAAEEVRGECDADGS